MHKGGEVDVRGSYCALNAALITGVLTDELKSGCASFIRDCMTYEGEGCVFLLSPRCAKPKSQTLNPAACTHAKVDALCFV